MIRLLLVIVLIFMFKAGRAINKFDISENISHSPKQAKNYKKEVNDD